MFGRVRHLTERRISDYAEGALHGRRLEQATTHLASCEACRARLREVGELGEELRALSWPTPPRDLKQQIMERLDTRDRVIALVPEPTRSGPRRRPALARGVAAVALIAAGTMAAVLLLSSDAEAGASSLEEELLGEDLSDGVRFEYRSASWLAAEDVLRLRGRYRLAHDRRDLDDPDRYFETVLTRRGDGTFEGTALLPAGAVYAVAAVEDPDGTRLDTGAGAYWSVTAPGTRLSLDALRQRYRTLQDRDWNLSARAADEMVELYPMEPMGWWLQLLRRQFSDGQASIDSVEAIHREQLQRLLIDSKEEPRPDPGGWRLAILGRYALALREERVADSLATELETRFPENPFAVQNRVIAAAAHTDPADVLSAFEREYQATGDTEPSLAEAGFQYARMADSPSLMVRWARRIDAARSGSLDEALQVLVSLPETRREGIALLRQHIDGLGRSQTSASQRPLHLSRAENDRALARREATLMASLGAALAADGQTDMARSVLANSAELGWDPAVFGRLAREYMALGDSVAALRMLARVAVDPLHADGGPAAAEDLGPLPDSLLSAADSVMRERLLADMGGLLVPGDPRVEAPDGRDVELRHLLAPGVPTVLAYWRVLGGAYRSDLPRLESRRNRLAQEGIELVVIARAEDPGAQSDLEFFLDSEGEALSALGLRSTREYLVLDGDGHIRFRHSDLDLAARQAILLGPR